MDTGFDLRLAFEVTCRLTTRRSWPADVKDAATQLRGNWRTFGSFAWFGRSEVENPDEYAIVYLSNRDSDIIDQSNEAVILRELAPFMGEHGKSDCWTESHSHWAVGHVDGVVIRCLDSAGEPTKAFAVLHENVRAKDGYPILDEADYSERMQEAESKDWEANGIREFRSALRDYFGHECERYPDSALCWLHSLLADRYNDTIWDEESGFNFEAKLENYEPGDLRIALRQARDRSVCHHTAGMLKHATGKLVCSVCGVEGPWERGESIVPDWPAPRFDGKEDKREGAES
jgi:hypothetical protein